MTHMLRNFGGELMQARRVVSAPGPERIRGAILRAVAEGGRVRPLGTGFTIRDVTVDDDAFLSTDGATAPALLTPPSGRRFVRVHAGTTVAEVTAFMRPRGLMLEVTPNFTGVSFVGAAATLTASRLAYTCRQSSSSRAKITRIAYREHGDFDDMSCAASVQALSEPAAAGYRVAVGASCSACIASAQSPRVAWGLLRIRAGQRLAVGCDHGSSRQQTERGTAIVRGGR